MTRNTSPACFFLSMVRSRAELANETFWERVMSEEKELVIRDDRGAVSYISLNRPRSGNSLSLSTIDELTRHLMDLRGQPSIAVIVLTGIGKKIFCAGHDLTEFDGETDPEFFKTVSTRCSALMQTMRDQPQVIIASVAGVASAAGCQLVASADLAIASSEARFATPGVNIGLWCLTPMVALSRAVMPKHAMQMLTTGRLYDAAFALRIGLINDVVTPEQLEQTVESLAAEIASKSTYTLALGKQAFYRQLQMPISDAYEYSGELVVRNMAHADAREGIAAFVQKRKPLWKGRK
ncbi:enoyl-CoA hydratase [Bradyrhizobium japonicum]|uniref:enoyl-CoA hydratase n=2 Tax=Nitrobacteraceae TaxID=41294 RepID=UPI001FD8A249|nr:enoyl-CoA hydratase [Bradyrhizobium japonicum]